MLPKLNVRATNKNIFRQLTVLFFMIILISCGGSGDLSTGTSDLGTDATVAENYSFSLQLTNEQGEAVSTIGGSSTLILTATLLNNSEPISGEVIEFSINDASLATLSGTSVATNTSGIASVQVSGGINSGSGTITANTTTLNTDINSINIGIESTGQAVVDNGEQTYSVFLIPASISATEYEQVSGSTMTTISSSAPATVLIKLVDAQGAAVEGSLVTAELLDSATTLATLSNDLGTILTDENGFAAINLIATDVSGAGYVQVSFDDGKTEKLAFQSVGDGNQDVQVEIGTIELLASSVQLASSGSDEVELTALVKDNNNNLIEGVQVSFSSDSGALEIVNATTAENGIATAKLNTLNNPKSRSIAVSAYVGDKSADFNVSVTGTSIKITGNDSVVTGDTVDMTVTLLDSDGNGIANRNIVLTATNNLTDAQRQPLVDEGLGEYVTTDSTGTAFFT